MNITCNGFLIHTRDYRETSSILKIFTEEGGIESIIFKGKHTSKDRFKFSIFNEYSFTFNKKYSLPYLSKYELVSENVFNKKYYLLGLEIDPKHKGINEYLGELYVATDRHNLAVERLEVLKGCNCEEYEELKDVIEGNKASKY